MGWECQERTGGQEALSSFHPRRGRLMVGSVVRGVIMVVVEGEEGEDSGIRQKVRMESRLGLRTDTASGILGFTHQSPLYPRAKRGAAAVSHRRDRGQRVNLRLRFAGCGKLLRHRAGSLAPKHARSIVPFVYLHIIIIVHSSPDAFCIPPFLASLRTMRPESLSISILLRNATPQKYFFLLLYHPSAYRRLQTSI